ncbi:unnamed protein product, partial [marine sediment metagenome]
LQLRSDLSDVILKHQEIQKKEKIYKIALANQVLTKHPFYTFVYNGTWYPTDFVLATDQLKEYNRHLDSSLVDQVEDLINPKDFELQVFNNQLRNLIDGFLLAAQHVNDLRNLFPDPFLSVIKYIDEAIFNIGNPQTVKQLEPIKIQQKAGLAHLGQLFMKELLLQQQR